MNDIITIHTDGGARGNPGPAAYAFVLARPGMPPLEEKGYLGETTNNIAEYTAVVRALERAKELGAKRILLKSDSELMVKQMTGVYKVKNTGLLPLYQEAQALKRGFDEVRFQHVRRELNAEADRLCNEALDGPREIVPRQAVPVRSVPAPERNVAPARKPRDGWSAARTEGLAILEEAAAAWRKGDDKPVVQVWNSVLTVLEKHGLVRD
ncbi:MAG: ribonuclease HI family protein [Gemmataceae bacterium]